MEDGDHAVPPVEDEPNTEVSIVTTTAVTVLSLQARVVILRAVVLRMLPIVPVRVEPVLQAPQQQPELKMSTTAVDNTKEVRVVREIVLMVPLVVVLVLLMTM